MQPLELKNLTIPMHRNKVKRTEIIISAMKANYQEIGVEAPEFRSAFNQMTLKIAVDVLAFYRALLTELPKSEALELIQPFVNNWMDGQFDC